MQHTIIPAQAYRTVFNMPTSTMQASGYIFGFIGYHCEHQYYYSSSSSTTEIIGSLQQLESLAHPILILA